MIINQSLQNVPNTIKTNVTTPITVAETIIPRTVFMFLCANQPSKIAKNEFGRMSLDNCQNKSRCLATKLALNCSKSTMETPEQCMKSARS